MGGHSAWRKRVANGELAKGVGGAIARHRPRWGRKGKDLKLNRKGNIGLGNPKKRKSEKSTKTTEEFKAAETQRSDALFRVIVLISMTIGCIVLAASFYYAATMH